MIRSALKRVSSLLRRSPMKRGPMRHTPRSTSYARRERDFDYMGAVKELACVARDLGRCEGVIEADHAGRRGISQKCPDDQTIPLCTRHHHDRDNFCGDFKNWDRAMMREFLDNAIAETRAIVLLRLGR